MIIKSYQLNKLDLKLNKILLFYGNNEGLKNECFNFISKKKIFDLIKNFTEKDSSSDIKFVKEIISTTVKDYNPDTKLVKTLKENII